MAQKVWIDMDLGLGTFPADIDDGFAFILAQKSPEVDLVGVSCVYGNVKMDVGFRNARKLIGFFPELNLKVLPGARSPADLDAPGTNPAVSGMERAIRRNPGEVVVVALGPLTNVARLFARNPGIERDVKELVVMGGSLRRGGRREFNFQNDARATNLVLGLGVPTRVFGLDVCCRQQFTNREYDRLREFARDSPLGRYLIVHSRKWLILNKLAHGGRKSSGFYPFDPVAVSYLVRPQLFEFARVPLRHTSGRWPWSFLGLKTYVDLAEWEAARGSQRKPDWWAYYATGIDSEGFMELLLERITS
ncbi:MAG: nucleoside hydrolase [Promethearchaeota archaeon]